MVCARKGSEGIPGKNLLELGGMTFLERAIAKCIVSDLIDVVYVSTDIDYTELQIEVAERGHEKPIIWQDRPSHLAGPDISKWPVFQFITKNAEGIFEECECCVDVDVSRPLTTAADLDNTIKAFLTTEAPALLAVSKAKKNPWQDTYVMQDFRIKPALTGGRSARQDQPPAYEHGGLFVVDRNALFAVDDMWELEVDSYEIERAHTFDVDDPLDWHIAQAVYEYV